MITITSVAAAMAAACLLVTIFMAIYRFEDDDADNLQTRLNAFVESRAPGKAEAHKERATTEIAVPTYVARLSSVLEPSDRIETQKLALALCHAGFASPNAYVWFLAAKCACMAVGAVIGFGLACGYNASTENLGLAVVLGAAVGMFVPILIIGVLGKRRQERIFLALPNAVDLLIIGLEAGTGIDQAIFEVSQELDGISRDLKSEFEVYGNEMRLGSNRRKALHNLGKRAGVDDLNSLANVLLQADRFGTGISQALREMARSVRHKRRQKAEERASKTAVTLLIPLILFIFPGIFVVLVGPAALTIFRDMASL